MRNLLLFAALILAAPAARADVDWTAAPTANAVAVTNALGQLSPGPAASINAGSARLDSGTTFSVAVSGSGCSPASPTPTGGAATGKFTMTGGGTCTFVITLGGSAAATNGWNGTMVDLTTAADLIHQSASTTTTITFVGTVATSDVIQFGATGY